MVSGPSVESNEEDEDQHGQICGGCGADMDSEPCDYALHEEAY